MTFKPGIALLIGFIAFFTTAAAQAYEEPSRTVNRRPQGIEPLGPTWMYNKPDYYEFTPLKSNHDPQNSHPAAWDGQDWDPSSWNPDWTPEIALRQFFRARIFEKQNLSKGEVPVVELGPTFYKLSDLDQRRTLKLWAQYNGVFENGARTVKLIDWWTHDTIGAYTPKGMFLN
jgi:hypothetical protein